MTKQQMAAFDELPSDVRQMLTTLDFNWLADHALILHRMGWSAAQIQAKLVDMGRAKHRADAATGAIVAQK